LADYSEDYIDYDYDDGPETDLEPVKACPTCGSADLDVADDCTGCHNGLIYDSQGDGIFETSMTFYCAECHGYGHTYGCENGHEFFGDGEVITKGETNAST
jgi:DnaJ-class molecular chaperone